jgi:hypothetical protein
MPLATADDLDTSPPEFLVEGMIPITGTGFIWGESRWGKSLLVNGELALAVANGTEFFGRRTVQGSVAICLGEGLYDAGVRKQARLAREQDDRLKIAANLAVIHGEEKAKIWLDSLPEYTDDNMFFMTEPFVLPMDNGGQPTRSLRAAIDSLKMLPDLAMVVLDSFSDFTPSLSISNDASANRSIAGMKMMARELDTVVLAVAHPTRNGDRMLGAGRLFNASDFVIKMEPDTGTGSGTPRSATVSCEKNKYGRPFEPFGYYIDPCAWREPVLDDDDLPTGEYDLVNSATVRPRDGDKSGAQLKPRNKKPLPTLINPEETAKKRKRTGLRSR